MCKACYSILSAQRGGRTEGGARTPEVSFTHVQPNMTGFFNRLAGMFLGFFFCQAEASSQLMRSFLFYGDNPKTWKQVWCVLRTEPPTLQLYAAQQVGPEPGRRALPPCLKGVTEVYCGPSGRGAPVLRPPAGLRGGRLLPGAPGSAALLSEPVHHETQLLLRQRGPQTQLAGGAPGCCCCRQDHNKHTRQPRRPHTGGEARLHWR